MGIVSGFVSGMSGEVLGDGDGISRGARSEPKLRPQPPGPHCPDTHPEPPAASPQCGSRLPC